MIPNAEQAAALDALLAEVPFEGWTEPALRRALVALGRPGDEARLLFPGGGAEMIEAHSALADQRMEAAAAALPALPQLRVPERIRAIIALRLTQSRGQKIAIGRALGWAALPINAGMAARMVGRTADAVWHAAGDKAADFSWYSKRGILSGVYGATLLFWLRDMSDDAGPTLAFLDRRLAEVAAFGGAAKSLDVRIASARAALRKRV